MIPPSDKQIEAGRMAHWATDPEMGLADYLRTIYLAMLKEAPVAQELVEPDRYDAGLLGDGGGGDVEWWQDYIRAELERAHEFYADQIAALQPTLPVPQGRKQPPDQNGNTEEDDVGHEDAMADPLGISLRGALAHEFGIVESMVKSGQLQLRGASSSKHEQARAALKVALQPTLPVPQGEVERVCDYCAAATPGTFNSDTCQCAALVRSPVTPISDERTTIVEWLRYKITSTRAQYVHVTAGELAGRIEAGEHVAAALSSIGRVSRPYGDAGDAIDFAVGCCGPEEAIAFLDDWRADRASEWPGYMRWLETQRDGAGRVSVEGDGE